SVSFSNRARNSAVRSWAPSEPETSATPKTATQNLRPTSNVLPLVVRQLARQRSNACGCLKVHVAVLVFVHFQKFLVSVQRQRRLAQFIVTSRAHEPASHRQRFLLRQQIQSVQSRHVILVQIFRRY